MVRDDILAQAKEQLEVMRKAKSSKDRHHAQAGILECLMLVLADVSKSVNGAMDERIDERIERKARRRLYTAYQTIVRGGLIATGAGIVGYFLNHFIGV